MPPGHQAPRTTPQVQEEKGIGPSTISFILDTTLHLQHREDPNVINFIKAYIECRDVNQAGRMAGLKPNQAQALKRRADIHEAIVKITDAAVLKHGYDASEVVERVKEIVGVDPGDLQKADGTFVTNLKELTPETRRAIKKFKAKNFYEQDPNGMKVLAGQLIEVEFWDKMKGIELLGREKEIFKETKKIEHDITKNMADVLLASKRLGEQAVLEMREVEATPVMIDVTPPKESSDGK